MRYKLWHWTVFQGLLSTSYLNIDSNGSLISWPVLGSDSDSIAQLVNGGGSWGLKGLWDLSEG